MEKLNHEVSLDGLVTRQFLSNDLELIVDYSQDVEPIFEHVKRVRHAFHIPNSVVMELLNHGVDVNKAPLKDIKKALRAIGKYELCDMTGKAV